ncbi:COG4223 family protein [uncultured Methylobacterium sp.]|uniref:COG4223 family protein n=1 Tax=uncultured Methylobacterium sp. TaxID=157278 RepID=UPI0035C9EE4C
MAAAGLLGGVLGAGLLFAVERAGVLPSQTGDLAGRLTALDRTVGTLASRDALASLDTRVAGNEAALKPLPEAVRKAEAAAREALEKTGAAPAATADGAASPAPAALPADLAARLDALDQRMAALQEEPGRDQTADAKVPLTQGGAPPDQIAKLDERLVALEGRIDGKVENAAKPADAPDPNAGLGPKLTALQGEIESRTKANAEADQALTQKLAALQASLDERVKAATEAVQTATEASRQSVEANKTQAEEAAKAVARQIQTQADRIAGLDKAVSERAETGTVQAALRVVSADRIATALSIGAPYSDALTSLRNLEPGDPARLTAVAVFADKGAPTAPSLAAEFRTIAERIAASRKAAQARTVAESGDITQRFMSMADSIIQVRKVDAPAAEKAQGADPLIEIQAALDRGAIGEAAKAFAALPDPLRAEAGEFGTKLASRAAAGEAAQGLLSDAFKGLSVSAPTRQAPAR